MQRFLTLVFCSYSFLVLIACENNTERIDCTPLGSDTSTSANHRQIIDEGSATQILHGILEDLTESTRSGFNECIISECSLISVSDFVEFEFSDMIPGFDNQFYLINFIDSYHNKGCAFLGASLNLPPVIAIYNNEWFSIDDCRKAWMYIYSANSQSLANQNVSTRSINSDPIIDPLLPTIPPISLIIGTPSLPPEDPNVRIHDGWEDGIKIGPLLKSHFHQWSPYNAKYDYYIDEEETPESDQNTIRDTINYPAGCTVIALAQIIAHNKINRDIGPSKIGATIIDWTNIKSIIEKQNREHLGLSYTVATQEEKDALADYCKAIADKVVTKYSPNGTSSNIWQARWLLNDFDNYCNFNIGEYDSAEIRTMITEHQLPIYVRGACTACDGGHAWVIDGLYQKNLIRTIITTETDEDGVEIISSRRTLLKTSELVHCNWGWNNNRDGWFEHMVFKSPTPIIGTAQTKDNTLGECDVDNYSDDVKMLIYNL